LAVAESQTQRGEFEAAVATYQDILKKDPIDRQAADEQVSATMQWVDHFGVLTREGQSATDIAAPKIDAMLPILDAGLARAHGQRAADILAHIGWVHWLNWHIAEREMASSSEQSFLRALTIEPSNVYANAMLGNWLLQTRGSLKEATNHFATAVQTGKERPWVRSMQLGALIYNEVPEARSELVKVVNDMRMSREGLSEDNKHRILSFIYDLSPSDTSGLRQALSAVPPADSWATYQWLDDLQETDAKAKEWHQLRRDYIYASILEVSGKQPQALSQYRLLQAKLKGSDYNLADPVKNAIKRLAVK
jgi:tetratricopeptide (TPR) repeat protein